MEPTTRHLTSLRKAYRKNGFTNKYNALVRSMLPGDCITIKASDVRKHGLPFDGRDQFVSVMAIKAVGTITENLGDRQVVRVEWRENEPRGEWYFFTNRRTVWCVEPGDWKSDGLIAFTFDNEPQDVERFRRA